MMTALHQNKMTVRHRVDVTIEADVTIGLNVTLRRRTGMHLMD